MTIAELAEKLYGEWRRWAEIFGASDQVPPQWRHLTTTARGRWERVARTAYDALKQTGPTPDMGEGLPVPDGYVGVPRRGLPLLDGETACPGPCHSTKLMTAEIDRGLMRGGPGSIGTALA